MLTLLKTISTLTTLKIHEIPAKLTRSTILKTLIKLNNSEKANYDKGTNQLFLQAVFLETNWSLKQSFC